MVYIQAVLERLHRCVPKDKIFYEIAVCKKGTKTEKGLLETDKQ